MKLEAKLRTVLGKKVKNLRNEGLVPATVYGPKQEPINLQVNAKNFTKLFDKVGYNKFFQLETEGEKPMRVLVKDVSFHPVKDYAYDISFYAIDEDSKITVDVPINLLGEAPAVKLNLGFLVQQMESVAIYCLPKDLPDHFDISVEGLENTGDSVSLTEIKLDENVEFDSDVDPTSAIAYIAAFQKEIVEEVPEDTEEAVEGEEGAEATGEPKEGAEAEEKPE